MLKDVTRGKKHCFQVSHSKKKETSRTFVFYAKNNEEMKSWISALSAAIRVSKKTNCNSLREHSNRTSPPTKRRPKSFSVSGSRVKPSVDAPREKLMAGHRHSFAYTETNEKEEKEKVNEYACRNDEKGKEKEKEKERETEDDNGIEQDGAPYSPAKDKDEAKEKEKEGDGPSIEKEAAEADGEGKEEEGNWREMSVDRPVTLPTISLLSGSKSNLPSQIDAALLETYARYLFLSSLSFSFSLLSLSLSLSLSLFLFLSLSFSLSLSLALSLSLSLSLTFFST